MVTWAELITPGSDHHEPIPMVGGIVESWWTQGYVILRRFIPPARVEAYATARELAEVGPEGWDYATPYMECSELRALCCDRELGYVLRALTGEPMGLHLNLTGWVSTERNWHQDGYLNPPGVGDRYAAVWFALGPIDPASGPFEYVPGSHLWGEITRERAWAFLDPEERGNPDWPRFTERFLTAAAEGEIARREATVERFLADSGDVLIWHPRLLHRGSPPETPGLLRPAVIAHYSAIGARPDFPPPEQEPGGGWYFPIRSHVPVR
jgi:hypothetical protein